MAEGYIYKEDNHENIVDNRDCNSCIFCTDDARLLVQSGYKAGKAFGKTDDEALR